MRREEDLNPLNPGPSEVEAAELNSGNFRDSRFGNLVTSGIFRGGGAVILGAGAAIGGAQLLQEALQNTPAPVHRGVNVAHAEDRESQPTKSPHTATPVGETPTVSPTPPPSETPPPTPSATATKEAPSPTATGTKEAPSATATEHPATATASATTTLEEEGQIKIDKYLDEDGDGEVPREEGEPGLIQRFEVDGPDSNDFPMTTDGNGYAVRAVEPGVYKVCEVQQPDLVLTTGDLCQKQDVRAGEITVYQFGNAQKEAPQETSTPQPTVEQPTPPVPPAAPTPIIPAEMPRAGTGPLDSTGGRVLTATTILGAAAAAAGALGLGFLKGGLSVKRAQSVIRYRLIRK